VSACSKLKSEGSKFNSRNSSSNSNAIPLPANRVNATLTYVPSVCTNCHTPLPIEPGLNDLEPSWHQVAELPRPAAVVTEHQARARTCPCRGPLNHAAIPAEVRAHVIGPPLAAMMSYLSGRFHLSKRSVGELVEPVPDAGSGRRPRSRRPIS